jgi:hypothetical protein
MGAPRYATARAGSRPGDWLRTGAPFLLGGGVFGLIAGYWSVFL